MLKMKKIYCSKCGKEIEEFRYAQYESFEAIGIDPDSFNTENELCIDCQNEANKKANK
jgi:RNA polymerase-binding transcription factor DksA